MEHKNRNLFRIARFFLLRLPPLFRFFSKFRSAGKRLVIIKTDAIGDYILFRNFIETVANSKKFGDFQIDLLGNELWKDVALKYDKACITNFYFIKPDELYESPLLLLKIGWKLYKANYQVVLQPTYSRTFIGDGLAGFTAAPGIIGFEGDEERINKKYKRRTDRFYTTKLQLPANCYFEFDRSKFFFEQVIEEGIKLGSPFLSFEKGVKNGIVICPGAGVGKRSWPVENFLDLITRLIQHTSHTVYLAGSEDDLITSALLMENLPAERVINLTGKTDLLQLIGLIGNAVLVISNESAAIHIAAATKTRSVCILGGGHFGRFAPYPENMPDGPVCVFEKMPCYHCNWQCIYEVPAHGHFPCISAVNISMVWDAVKLVL